MTQRCGYANSKYGLFKFLFSVFCVWLQFLQGRHGAKLSINICGMDGRTWLHPWNRLKPICCVANPVRRYKFGHGIFRHFLKIGWIKCVLPFKRMTTMNNKKSVSS